MDTSEEIIFCAGLKSFGPLNVDNYFQLQNHLIQISEEDNYSMIASLLQLCVNHLETNMIQIITTSILDTKSALEVHLPSFHMHLMLINAKQLYYISECLRVSIKELEIIHDGGRGTEQTALLLQKLREKYEEVKKRM